MNKRAFISGGILLVAVVGLVFLSLRKDKTKTSSEFGVAQCPIFKDYYFNVNFPAQTAALTGSRQQVYQICEELSFIDGSNIPSDKMRVVDASGKVIYEANIDLTQQQLISENFGSAELIHDNFSLTLDQSIITVPVPTQAEQFGSKLELFKKDGTKIASGQF